MTSDGGENAVERSWHALEVERADEEWGVADLPVPHEPPQLLLEGEVALRGLLLERAERAQLPMLLDDPDDRLDPERAHELVLEVLLADVEPQLLETRASEVRAEPGALEASGEGVLLARVAEAGEPHVEPARAEPRERGADRMGAADWHHGNAVRLQVATTTSGEGLDGALVADALDEDDGVQLSISRNAVLAKP